MDQQRYGRADVHIHTTASDGTASPRATLDYIARIGTLDVVAITDHDHIDSSLWAQAQQGRYPFAIIPGMEVTSAEGHVLALWVTDLIPAGLSLNETVSAIHEQGGVAVMAHPVEPAIMPKTAWRYFRNPEVLLHAGIDAIEVFNAGAITPGSNWLAQRVFGEMGVPLVGNSDSHLLETIGRGCTRFPGHSAADLRTALANCQTVAEGKPWAITTYLKLSRISIQNKLNSFSGTNVRSSKTPTHL